MGYSLDDICSIIHEENSWAGYDSNMTYNQAKSIFRGYGTTLNSTSGISSPSCIWIKHEDWVKRYGKRFCTLHYVS
ncbi:MAG: hypothetical protein Q8P40_05030, partial [Nitrospirota bacterium]|nr:hypothetical protein [Nitrospirota bacterium]